MKHTDRDVEPGDRFINQDNNERCTVVGIETWGEGLEVALLEYEDGVTWDEALTGDGTLPNPPYTPLPESSPGASSGATLEDACDPDEHVFNAEPSKHPVENTTCIECGLSSMTIGNFLGHPTWNRLPTICSYCETELTADDDRLFIEDEFICMDCCGTNYNVYVECGTDELHTRVLHCKNNVLGYLNPQVHDGTCGFVATATPETTRRFLDPPYDYPDDPGDVEPCPECGDSVTFSRVLWNKHHAALFRIVVDGVRDVEELLHTEAGDDVVAERMGEMFPTGKTSRVLSDEVLETYAEFCRRYSEKCRAERRQQQREKPIFKRVPSESLAELTRCEPAELLLNAEPGCQVAGYPDPDMIVARKKLEGDIEGGSIDRSDVTPGYVVVQTRDGEAPKDETVTSMRERGYVPVDDEHNEVGSGGWPVTVDDEQRVDREVDEYLIGAYVFKLIDNVE